MLDNNICQPVLGRIYPQSLPDLTQKTPDPPSPTLPSLTLPQLHSFPSFQLDSSTSPVLPPTSLLRDFFQLPDFKKVGRELAETWEGNGSQESHGVGESKSKDLPEVERGGQRGCVGIGWERIKARRQGSGGRDRETQIWESQGGSGLRVRSGPICPVRVVGERRLGNWSGGRVWCGHPVCRWFVASNWPICQTRPNLAVITNSAPK